MTAVRASSPTVAELLADFGEDYLSIQSLFRFCFVPGGRLGLLKELALDEEWGANSFVLLKYLAVHVRLAVEQERFVWNDGQIVLTAGRLATRTGAPIYVGLVPNQDPEENPWVLNWVGERPSCAVLPQPADLGRWESLLPGAEVVIAWDPTLGERRPRLGGLEGCDPVAQVCALTGAVHWALHRGLAVPQIHGAGRGYLVPVYLRARDDVDAAPDAVAPVQPHAERLVVRTLLEPHVAYSPARAVVERCERLPSWIRDAWARAVEEVRPDGRAPGGGVE